MVNILFQIIIGKTNDNYNLHNSRKFNIFHSDNEISNIPNNNDINSKIDISNMNFKFINTNNLKKRVFNIKNSGELQHGSFSNKDVDIVSFVKKIKDGEENNKEMPKIKINRNPIVYRRKNPKEVSNYTLLLFHKFNCCLSHEKQVLSNMNNMYRNLLFKKIDIERYLDLFKKVDYLINAQNLKNKSTKNNLVHSLNLLSNHI